MKCYEALCDAGAEICCHECDRFKSCEDEWKCHEINFYDECLGEAEIEKLGK